MYKGVAALIVAVGLMLSTNKPSTKSELDTARVRLEYKVEAVEKKIDNLTQQAQLLNKRMEMLDRRLAALQKHFNIELSPQVDEPQAPQETVTKKSE